MYICKENIITCDLVSTVFKLVPLLTFHNLMVLSAVPPPEAKIPGLHGHQAKPFTAAIC